MLIQYVGKLFLWHIRARLWDCEIVHLWWKIKTISFYYILHPVDFYILYLPDNMLYFTKSEKGLYRINKDDKNDNIWSQSSQAGENLSLLKCFIATVRISLFHWSDSVSSSEWYCFDSKRCFFVPHLEQTYLKLIAGKGQHQDKVYSFFAEKHKRKDSELEHWIPRVSQSCMVSRNHTVKHEANLGLCFQFVNSFKISDAP